MTKHTFHAWALNNGFKLHDDGHYYRDRDKRLRIEVGEDGARFHQEIDGDWCLLRSVRLVDVTVGPDGRLSRAQVSFGNRVVRRVLAFVKEIPW